MLLITLQLIIFREGTYIIERLPNKKVVNYMNIKKFVLMNGTLIQEVDSKSLLQ